jgi:hypothetical protein
MADIVLEVPFLAGIDQSVRSEVVDASQAYTALYNVRQGTVGGVSKRPGFGALPATRLDGTTRGAALRQFMSGDQLCTIDQTPQLDVYSPKLARSVPKGLVPEASCRLIPAPTLGTSTAYVRDIVYCNGVAVISSYVFQVALTDYHYVTVLDRANEAILRKPEVLFSAASLDGCRLATYGVYVIALTLNSSDNTIRAHYLDTTSATTLAAGWVSIGTVANDVYAVIVPPSPVGFDVSSFSDRVAFAYSNASGGTNLITVKTLTIAGVLATTTVNTSSIQPPEDGIGISEGGATLWLTWSENTTVRAMGLDPSTLATTATPTAVFTAAGATPISVWVAATAAGQAAVFGTSGDAATTTRAIKIAAGATATNGALLTAFNAELIGRPFYFNSRVYAPFASSNGEEVVLCDCTPDTTGSATTMYLRPVASPIQRGLLSVPAARRQARSAAVSASAFWFGFLTKKSGTTTGTTLAEFDFASVERWKPAVANGSTCLAGGIVAVFDGVRVFEAAFLCRPPKPSINKTLAGSVTLATGRNYVVTYEEIDAYGNWHVSGVSDPVSSGTCTSKKIVLTVPPLSITARGSNAAAGGTSLRIAVWGTHDGGTAPYFRIGEVANNPQSNTLTVTDNVAEANFGTTALLYSTGSLPGTDGSSQDHRAPPGLKHIVAYNGMIVGAADNVLFFSSQPIDGQGQWFSPAFVAVMEDDVTALEVMDGALVIFMKRRIYVTSGDIPSDNGSSGGLATPRRLSVDVGSIDGKTLSTSAGIFFRSDRGIDLLNRGLAVDFIGANVQDEVANFPSVACMALDTKNNLARLSLAQSLDGNGFVSGNGRDVVYDLILKKWISIDRKSGTVADQPSQDSGMVFLAGSWRYAWLAADGTVYFETAVGDGSDYLDPGGGWVTMGATTPWIHIAGLQGEQFIDQVLLLAQRVTSHDVTISLAFDYADTFTSTKTFTSDQIDALAREWLVKEVSQTTSNAIRVQITDAVPSAVPEPPVLTGEGATWVCLTLSGQPHRGPKRTTGAQRGGA